MSKATNCVGCGKLILEENNSPIFMGGNVVGHVHKVPGAIPTNVTPICIRQAFWSLRKKNPAMFAITIDGKIYNALNTPDPTLRRPSGVGISAVPYAMEQKRGVGITHTYNTPSHS